MATYVCMESCGERYFQHRRTILQHRIWANLFFSQKFFPFKFLLLANKISNASAEVKVMLTIAFNLDLIAVEIALSRSSQCHNWAKEFGWLKRMDTIRSVELCTLCVNSWIKEWIARTWTFLRLFIYNFCFM